VRFYQFMLKIQSALARQPDIEHKTTRCVGPLDLQKLPSSVKRIHLRANRANKALNGVAHGQIVVNDEDDGVLFCHPTLPCTLVRPSFPDETGFTRTLASATMRWLDRGAARRHRRSYPRFSSPPLLSPEQEGRREARSQPWQGRGIVAGSQDPWHLCSMPPLPKGSAFS
jgi:hypothetical protein